MVVVSPAALTLGVRTRLNCGEKVISGSYTPSSDFNVVSAKRTLSRDTSMSLLLSNARRIAWLRVKESSPPPTPTRVRSGSGGTGSDFALSNGSSRRSFSARGCLFIGSCAIAAELRRNKHGRNANEMTLNNILIVLTPRSTSGSVEVIGYSLDCSFEYCRGLAGYLLAHPPAGRPRR